MHVFLVFYISSYCMISCARVQTSWLDPWFSGDRGPFVVKKELSGLAMKIVFVLMGSVELANSGIYFQLVILKIFL